MNVGEKIVGSLGKIVLAQKGNTNQARRKFLKRLRAPGTVHSTIAEYLDDPQSYSKLRDSFKKVCAFKGSSAKERAACRTQLFGVLDNAWSQFKPYQYLLRRFQQSAGMVIGGIENKCHGGKSRWEVQPTPKNRAIHYSCLKRNLNRNAVKGILAWAKPRCVGGMPNPFNALSKCFPERGPIIPPRRAAEIAIAEAKRLVLGTKTGRIKLMSNKSILYLRKDAKGVYYYAGLRPCSGHVDVHIDAKTGTVRKSNYKKVVHNKCFRRHMPKWF